MLVDAYGGIRAASRVTECLEPCQHFGLPQNFVDFPVYALRDLAGQQLLHGLTAAEIVRCWEIEEQEFDPPLASTSPLRRMTASKLLRSPGLSHLGSESKTPA
jgi:hypothetical protein